MHEHRSKAKDIAEALRVKPATIRKWVHEFDIPHDRSTSEMVFDQEAITILNLVKQWKDEDGAGTQTIRRRIAHETHEESQAMREQCSENKDNAAALREQQERIVADMQVAVTTAIRESNDLAEKYARATYQIGQQDERIKNLESQLKALPAPEEYYKLKAENEQLKNPAGFMAWLKKLFG